ncbi:MAG: hypothetical protein K2G59_05165 [Muribaculaceae bacterium]|nr:hypothetical protein [Muribaculaceae bacterium]
MLAVASAAALVACGGNKEAQTEEAAATEVEVIEEVVDSAACCADTAACCADTAACCADSTVVAE